MDDAGPLCLACADMNHLIFLPSAIQQAEEQCLADEDVRLRRRERDRDRRALDEKAITLAVVASVRHEDTDYDLRLMSGTPRQLARDQVRPAIDRVLGTWTG